MHNHEASPIQVAIIGVSGYSGHELARLLKRHPHVTVKAIFNSQNANSIDPSDYQVIFLATPAEVSAALAPKFIAKGVHVIDLSGAFRLKTNDITKTYQEWYGLEHSFTELVATAHYGLSPWFKPKKENALLIANPGCFATAVLMGLLPLLGCSLIQADSIVIDAKSGTTGAGKKAVESQLFSEVEGECLPYKVGVHQHLPEIKLYSQIDPFFTTSLLPVRRGIIAGMYAKLNHGKNSQDVANAFKEFYMDYPLIEVSPVASREMLSLKNVVGTGKTHISFTVVGEKLYLFSCIDNLLKGAASQAVENLNHLYQFPVTAGLDHLEAII